MDKLRKNLTNQRKGASPRDDTDLFAQWRKEARQNRKAGPPKFAGIRWKRRDCGGFLIYHRASNTKLPGNWRLPEFQEALTAAEKAYRTHKVKKAAPPKPTVASLVREYEASPNWKNLSPNTRAVEIYMINSIMEDFSKMPLAVVEARGSRKLFLEWHADLIDERGPRAADMRLGRLQTIFKFGFDREDIARNPLATFKRAYKGDRSMVIWTRDHFEQLNASKASPEMKLAAFFALHTGQRRGDLIAAKWDQWDGTGLTFVQSKTKQKVYVPATRELKKVLEKLLELRIEENDGMPVLDQHILLAARGKPFTSSGFRQAWFHAMETVDFSPVIVDGKEFELHFHDIRGTTITLLAEAGATIPEIASITGHKLDTVHKILERYLSRSKTLAVSAISKLNLTLLC